MKRTVFLTLLVFSTTLFWCPAFAQQPEKQKEIIIKLKDGKEITITGDSISGPDFKFSPDDIRNVTVLNGRRLKSSDNGISLYFPDSARLRGRLDSLRLSRGAGRLWSDFSQERTYLGVQSKQADKGAEIVEVMKGSPAEKAGLKKGDIITRLEKDDIDSPEKLSEVIRSLKPDQKVTIIILRDGKKKDIKAVLGADSSMARIFVDSLPSFRDFRFNMPNLFDRDNPVIIEGWPLSPKPELGLQVQDTDDASGVTVLHVNDKSPAATAGVRQGDLITEVNGKKVSGVSDIQNEIRQSRGNEYTLQLVRDGKPLQVVVKIPKVLRKADL